ncbi:MAG: DUF3786 domain-containing protein [Deltaproteobacteria bacterium]|nr:DUF3786 domain-containing protein [Deltaproteobacteria bacterium]
MARVDDYQMSFDLAAQKIAEKNFVDVARRAGATAADDGESLELSYFGRPVRVEREPMKVYALDEGPELPLVEQALILHYLANADGSEPTGEWITFREVSAGEFYWSAFVKRAKAPLTGFFGGQPKLLAQLAPLVGGRVVDAAGDVAVEVRALPRVPLLLQIWEGDDEFPADGNVLLDKNVEGYFNTEDIALLSGLPIYKMMALARSRPKA